MVETNDYYSELPFQMVIPTYGPCDGEHEPDDNAVSAAKAK